MKEIFFSIVIPTYNRSSLIEYTINSILNQTYQNYEILIIDDGSTDNTSNIINNLYYNLSKVKYFYKKNEERGAARNFGIKFSKGDYIIFIDSDDLMKSNHLSVINNYLHINKNININFFATKFEIHKNGKLVSKSLLNLKGGLYNYEFLLDGNHFACNFGIKSNNLNLKLFREERKYSILEDWIFLLENLYDDKIHLIDCYTIIMSDHDHRSMKLNNFKIIKAKLNALNYIKNLNIFNKVKLNIILGEGYYFCAIHSLISRNIKYTIIFILKSFSHIGLNFKLIKLIIKIIIFKLTLILI